MVVAGAGLTLFVALSLALIARHRSFHSAAFDLAFFDQIIWNTSEGRWFETSFVSYNFLGQHFEPILLVFAAVYRIVPSVEALLVIQAAALGFAVVPLYLAGTRLFASRAAAAGLAASFVLLPWVHGAALFDFHPEVLAPPLLFASLALAVRRRTGLSVVTLASVLLIKEDLAFAVLGFAAVYWHLGDRRLAIKTGAGAIAYLVVVLALMALIRGEATSDLWARYGYLKGDPPANVLEAPWRMAEQFVTGGGLAAVAAGMAALAGLPVLTLGGLAAAPAVLLNGLSSHDPQAALTVHYGVVPISMLTIAAALGGARLCRARPGPGRRFMTVAMPLAACVAFVAGSPLGPSRFEPEGFTDPPSAVAVRAAISLVPDGVPVSAQSGILPHLSQRRGAYEFPELRDAEYVVVDRSSWRSDQTIAAGFDAALAGLRDRGFCSVFADGGLEVYRKCKE